jgi:predicted nucleic acid-binding Zn ribbon protein
MHGECLHCGQGFIGRSDKKFCSHQCRSAWHQDNQLKQDYSVQQIIRRLSRNRQLIKKLLSEGYTKVGRAHLLDLGFDFHYYTHCYKTKGENVYYFCFDAGYRILPANKLLLVLWQDYMQAWEVKEAEK